MNKELVISVFDKNIDWINTIEKDVKITIYRKGENTKSSFDEVNIEKNVGRDVHTFFFHIYENYNILSDITFFSQDFPFDHWGNILDIIYDLDKLSYSDTNFGGYYGFHNNQLGSAWSLTKSNHFENSKVLVCSSTGSPQHNHENLNLDNYWSNFFRTPTPSEYEFIPGGHFAITKEQVWVRPKQFYKKILTFLETEIVAPWVIERFECYIFNQKFEIL